MSVWQRELTSGTTGVMTPEQPEQPVGPNRVRQIFDTSEDLRNAIRLRAFRQGVSTGREVSTSDIINAILEEVLTDELDEVRRLPKASAKSKPGRKKGKPKPPPADQADEPEE